MNTKTLGFKREKFYRTRWYVFANRSRAVFYADAFDQPFQFVDRLFNRTGSAHESEFYSDGPGRSFSSAGGGSIHHSLGRDHVHHEKVARKFVHRIIERLEIELRNRRMRELIIAAEPHFLGLLRKSMPQHLKQIIIKEVGAEYIRGSDEMIRNQLRTAIHRQPWPYKISIGRH